MTQHFRTSNPDDIRRDSAIDKHKAATKAQVERDWGIRPQNPVLKPSEAASLDKFRNQAAEQSLDRQQLAKQGGQRAVEQKAKATAMLQSQNEHGSK